MKMHRLWGRVEHGTTETAVLQVSDAAVSRQTDPTIPDAFCILRPKEYDATVPQIPTVVWLFVI